MCNVQYNTILQYNIIVLLVCNVQAHMKGSELLDHVFDHLNLVEKDYFGVGYQADSNKMVRMSLLDLQLCLLYSLVPVNITRVRTILKQGTQYPIILVSSDTNTQYQYRYYCLSYDQRVTVMIRYLRKH